MPKIAVFIFPLIAIICLIPMYILYTGFTYKVFGEDHFFEYLQVAFYFLSSSAALLIGVRFVKARNNLFGSLYLVLAFALFVATMEEISWGQRIFDLPTPTFFTEHNFQGEINIHNIGETWDYLHLAYTVVGFAGAFAWLILPAGIKVNYSSWVTFFVPSWYLSSYFLPVFLIYLYFIVSEYLGGFFLPLRFGEQEPAELMMSLGILVFLTTRIHRQSLQRF